MRYKVNVLAKLKEEGYTSYRLIHEGLLHEVNVHAFRKGKMVSWKVLEKVCNLLHCEPGDLIEVGEDEDA